MDRIPPRDRPPIVGIIGGGQLARMLIQAAISLNLEVKVLAQPKDTSVKGLIDGYLITDHYDEEAIARFASECDIVTFEHELVDPTVLASLGESGVNFQPPPETMRISSDKAAQRLFLSSHGLPTPPYHLVNNEDDLLRGGELLGFPAVLKAARGGYDGRGVLKVKSLDHAKATLGDEPFSVTYVMEPELDISMEFAILTVRSATGEIDSYAPLHTVQVDGICVEVLWPAELTTQIAERARAIALRIATATNSTGIQAVEFFVASGKLMVNELAPRVHNSGHLTIEAAVTSQFENHLRAILGLPLGSTEMVSPAAMANVIADDETQSYRLSEALSNRHGAIHLYNKSPKPNRKVGHVTVTDTSLAHALRLARDAASQVLQPRPTKES